MGDSGDPLGLDSLGLRSGKIKQSHLDRIAVLYVRQSSNEQVRDHRGSLAAQLALADLPRQWGWPDSRIKIIDRDLGLSGTSSAFRPGFLEMFAMIGRGEVGMVMALAVDRLARKVADFDNLLDLTGETNTLLCIDGVVYDPSSEDTSETLGLQVQALLGSAGNRVSTRRFVTGRLAKARLGQAVSPPPTGYVKSGPGHWEKDPNQRVQDAIVRAFEQYLRLGSLGRVVRYFHDNALDFPRRIKGETTFGPCNIGLLHSVLRNRAYEGTYVFLRHQSKKRDGRVTVRLRPESEWIVRQDHHPAYVPKEIWQRVQEMLHARRPAMRPLIGKGNALLQTLLRCGDCGRPMRPRYWGREHMVRTAKYLCLRLNDKGEPIHRVTFPARFVDEVVVRHVLEKITAIDDKTAHVVIEAADAERAGLERSRQRRIEDARDQVERLRRFVLNTSPEHADARADLMTEYNAAAKCFNELKTQLSAPVTERPSLDADDVPELVARTRDAQMLWQSPRRTNEDRKRLLQTVISEVILHNVTRDSAEVEVVWKSDVRTSLVARRPRGVDAYVAERTHAGKAAQQIADELNAAGAVTASGRPLSGNVVIQKQRRLGIGLTHERLLARQIIRDGLMAHAPRPDLLRQLNERAPRLGPWDPQRLSEAIRRLRKGVANIEPLPAVLPADQEKQEVLKLIEQALRTHKDWVTMAKEFNEAGRRPPRGAVFTPVGLRLLYLRAHGLRSFTLSSSRTDNRPGGA
jgi:DNA invertase Pin-like site-specific DNA recombinase